MAQRSAMRYDKGGDAMYDAASALMKSLRGSDPDAALHYLARFLEAGDLIRSWGCAGCPRRLANSSHFCRRRGIFAFSVVSLIHAYETRPIMPRNGRILFGTPWHVA